MVGIKTKHKKQAHVLRGVSMCPFIEPGERLLVSTVPVDSIKKYQIIAFCNGPSSDLVSHRVLQITYEEDGPVFITRGDNPRSNLSVVRASQVQGVVVGKIKNGSEVFFGRVEEILGYMRSSLYWRFKIRFKFLTKLGFNLIYPFLRKKYALFESNEMGLSIKVVALGKSIGECRINEDTTQYFFCGNLNPFWKKFLQSQLCRKTLKKDLVCKNSTL